MAYIQRNVLRIDDDTNNEPASSTRRSTTPLHLVREEKPMFSSIEHLDSRRNAVMASIGVHIVLVTVLIVLPLWLVDSLKIPRYDALLLVPPPLHEKPLLEVTHWKQPATPKPKPIIAPPPVKAAVAPPVQPPRELPKVAEVKPPEVHFKPKPVAVAAEALPAEAPAPKPEKPKPVVKTDVFGGNQAEATLNLPAKKVQTGGFGDPNGVRGEGTPNKPANIASLGSFDLPVGEGAGNGTGGAKGARGIVTSVGFGNGIAGDGGGNGHSGRAGSGGVQQGGFGDESAAAGPAEKKHSAVEDQASAVEITFKPRPDYTEEARKQKLQGEVLLHVRFTADGHIQVLNVVRGLGHGLDESAVRAAQQMLFKPAMKDGRAVDSTATVHIVFQLAY